MRRRVLQNTSTLPNSPTPTIRIVENDPEWDEALARWLAGKMPTDSPEWKVDRGGPYYSIERIHRWSTTILYEGTGTVCLDCACQMAIFNATTWYREQPWLAAWRKEPPGCT